MAESNYVDLSCDHEGCDRKLIGVWLGPLRPRLPGRQPLPLSGWAIEDGETVKAWCLEHKDDPNDT